MNDPHNRQPERHSLSAIRQKLAASSGRDFWRSLDEVADTPDFRELLENEFPKEASVWQEGVGRRNFLKLMGASLALGGLTACSRQPEEKIVPYVKPPEEVIPGKPLYFATALPRRGYGIGVLAESHMGRPTKIEGNPKHPASLGATGIFEQASMLTMYDPDRARNILQAGVITTWQSFTNAIDQNMASFKQKEGEGLRVLTETVTSPTLAAQLTALTEKYPKAQWHQYDANRSDSPYEGTRMVFGAAMETRYDFSKADVILALDADFLYEGPGQVRYAHDFSERRDVKDPHHAEMNRLYAVETMPSVTGGAADHRWAMTPVQVEAFARAVAIALSVPGIGAENVLTEGQRTWACAVAKDLKMHGRTGLVIPGDFQQPVVHAIAHAINARLGAAGTTVFYTDPVEANPANQLDSIRALANDIDEGAVEMLLIIGGNPAFTAPADLEFAEALKKVPLAMRVGLYYDETAALCEWMIPMCHPLESWEDLRAYDGTGSIVQPLIAPLYEGHTASEVIDVVLENQRKAFDIVQAFWKEQLGEADFDQSWEQCLSKGYVEGTALPAKHPSIRNGFASAPLEPAEETVILFRPDPTIGDGFYANNGWLQELPKPISKLTWDNALFMSPAMAEQLEFHQEMVLEVAIGSRTIPAPVWILPGHADKAVTLHLGYGRTRAGRVGDDAGCDAYQARTSDGMWSASGVTLKWLGKRYHLATTQEHAAMHQHGRPLALMGTLDHFKQDPHFAQHKQHEPAEDMTLQRRPAYDGHAWAMTIDLNKCIGCGGCTVACQSENNIPVVGKEQVLAGREMHWIRVDRYFGGDNFDEPKIIHQPVPCMQCEKAPCEVVCPVAATSHSKEGLNDMVYNRCVGTRYCSNNCPYKVRRFNFFHFTKHQYKGNNVESLESLRNPDVTVRTRGVMEKCTYCVQRINSARIEAKKEERPVRDGEITTACQQVCPTGAILFGDLSDTGSRVSKQKEDPRNYSLLAELNTRPRTTYLARLRNPNPEIEPPEEHSGEAHGHGDQAHG